MNWSKYEYWDINYWLFIFIVFFVCSCAGVRLSLGLIKKGYLLTYLLTYPWLTKLAPIIHGYRQHAMQWLVQYIWVEWIVSSCEMLPKGGSSPWEKGPTLSKRVESTVGLLLGWGPWMGFSAVPFFSEFGPSPEVRVKSESACLESILNPSQNVWDSSPSPSPTSSDQKLESPSVTSSVI